MVKQKRRTYKNGLFIPTLAVRDMKETIAFYKDVLGFKTGMMFPDAKNPEYADLSKDDMVLMLIPAANCGLGAEEKLLMARVRHEAPAAFSAALAAAPGEKEFRQLAIEVLALVRNIPARMVVAIRADREALWPLLGAVYRDVAERFGWVTLVRNERNEGYAIGNNIGAERATGEYLFLLNSDTEVPAGALTTLVRFLDAVQELVRIPRRIS